MVRLNRFFAAVTSSGARGVLILLGCVALVIVVVLCWYVILTTTYWTQWATIFCAYVMEQHFWIC